MPLLGGHYTNRDPGVVVVDHVPIIRVPRSATDTGVGRKVPTAPVKIGRFREGIEHRGLATSVLHGLAAAVAVLATLAIGPGHAAPKRLSTEQTSPPMQVLVAPQSPPVGQTNIIDEIKGGVLPHDVGFLNANLAMRNAGITSSGVRIGFKF